jgi:hypothetical protein
MNASRAELGTRLWPDSLVAPRRVIRDGSLKRTRNARVLAAVAESKQRHQPITHVVVDVAHVLVDRPYAFTA